MIKKKTSSTSELACARRPRETGAAFASGAAAPRSPEIQASSPLRRPPMKLASLICAAALVVRRHGTRRNAKPRAPERREENRMHRAHAIARPAPRPQDPYKAYWNDPSRSGRSSCSGYRMRPVAKRRALRHRISASAIIEGRSMKSLLCAGALAALHDGERRRQARHRGLHREPARRCRTPPAKSCQDFRRHAPRCRRLHRRAGAR